MHPTPNSPVAAGEALTARQRMIFDYLVEFSQREGYPPTMREIGEFFGIRSTNAVHEHLRALERKGWVERAEGASRGVRVMRQPTEVAAAPVVIVDSDADGDTNSNDAEGSSTGPTDRRASVTKLPGRVAGQRLISTSRTGSSSGQGRTVAILGQVAAGVPIPALELADDRMVIDESLTGGHDVFALRVVGRSMIDAGILPQDLILVRPTERVDNGKIAVVEIDGEVTVKRFYAERGGIRLVAENREMAPIVLDAEASAALRVVGVVQGVIRALR